MRKTHVIGRQQFIIDVSREEDAQMVYTRVSDLVNNRLTQLMGELLTKLVPEEQMIRIDRLVIEAGLLDNENFEAQLTDRILAALRAQIGYHAKQQQELAKREISQKTLGKKNVNDLGHSGLAALDFFLKSGRYPWWLPLRQAPTPSELLLAVLDESLPAVRKLILRSVADHQQLDRWQFQFTPKALREVHRRIAPSAWNDREQFIDLLTALLSASASNQRQTGRKLLQVMALQVHELKPGTQQFTARFIELLAAFFNRSRVEIGNQLGRGLRLLQKEKSPLLDSLQVKRIKPLYKDLLTMVENSGQQPVRLAYEQDIAYLTTGTPSDKKEINIPATERRIAARLRDREKDFITSLWPYVPDEKVIRNLYNTHTPELKQAFINWYWGKAWSELHEYLDDAILLLERADFSPSVSSSRPTREHLLINWTKALAKWASSFKDLPFGNLSTARRRAFYKDVLSKMVRKHPQAEKVFRAASSQTLKPSTSGEKSDSALAGSNPTGRDERASLPKTKDESGSMHDQDVSRSVNDHPAEQGQSQPHTDRPEEGHLPQSATAQQQPEAKRADWKTDLPDLIGIEKGTDPSSEKVNGNGKLLGAFRHYLELGALPAGNTEKSLRVLLEAIHRQAFGGNRNLFTMLARVLEDETIYQRFRQLLPLPLLYVLSYQLVLDEPEDLQRSNPNRLPFLPPSSDDQTTEEGRTGHAGSETVATPAAGNQSSPGTKEQEHQAANFPTASTESLTGEQTGTEENSATADLPAPADHDGVSAPASAGNDAGLTEPFSTKDSNPDQSTTEGNAEPLIPDAARSGAGPQVPTDQTNTASGVPLHLRPRPESHAMVIDERWPGRRQLFALLPKLFSANSWWNGGLAAFQRWTYAHLVRQRLMATTAETPLKQLVREWVKGLAEFAEEEPALVADWLVANATKAGYAHSKLVTTLRTVQQLGDTTTTARNDEGAASPEDAPPSLLAWATRISSQNARIFSDRTPLQKDFDLLLRPTAASREEMAVLLAGKKVFPEQLRLLISTQKWRRLQGRLISDLPKEVANTLREVLVLLSQSKVYSSAREATEQFENYVLVLRWGGLAIAPAQLQHLTDKLLALVAREHRLLTKHLAARLLSNPATASSSPALRAKLEVMRTRISEKEVEQIKQATENLRKSAQSMAPKKRDARYLLAVLDARLRGQLKWWDLASGSPGELLVEAAKKDIAATRQLLNTQPAGRRKLLPSLTDKEHRAFIEIVFPDYSGFVLAWAEMIQGLYVTERTSASASFTPSWLAGWDFFLSGKSFSSEDFLRSGIKITAAALSLSHQELLKRLVGEANNRAAGNQTAYYRMATVLKELVEHREESKFYSEAEKQGLKHFSLIPEEDSSAATEEATLSVPDPTKIRIRPDATATPKVSEPDDSVEDVADPPESGGNAEASLKESRATHSPATNNLEDSTAESPPDYGQILAEEVAGLRHFFFYGTLPQKHADRTHADLLALQRRIIERHPEVASEVYQAVLGDHIARRRLFRFFEQKLWREIALLLIGYRLPWAERIWSDLQQLVPDKAKQNKGRTFVNWAISNLLSFPALGRASPNLTEYPEFLLTAVAERAGTRLESLFQELRDKITESSTSLKEDWGQLLAGIQERKNKQKKQADASAQKHQTMDEKIFVHNSGLVILAPFLSRYFQTLGMLENNDFRSEEEATRGVLLLEYLVTGQLEMQEHRLSLNKLLCGLPLETPIPSSLNLTDEEENVSGQLLNAVLQNWDKMKNSSVENLRGSFLLREGRLQEFDERWELVIEKQGFDILLQFLPWTISMVKLPWMETRLETKWPTTP